MTRPLCFRRRRNAGAVGALVAMTLAAGCAARAPRSMADRFVQRADDPAADDTAAAPQRTDATPETGTGSSATWSSTPVLMQSTSLEDEDPALAAALAGLDGQPTAAAHQAVALEYRRLGVFDLAERHLSAAIALDPSDAVAFDARARVWRDWGEPGIGLSDASRALYLAPEWAVAHNTLGTILYAVGQLEEAESRLEVAMALDPAAAYIRNNLCHVALARGDAVLARTRCDEALDRTPTLAVAWNNRALVSAAQGRLDEAQHDFEQVDGAGVSNFNLGLVLLSLGEYATAAERFDRALEEAPGLARAASYAAQARRLADGGGR